MVELSSTSPTMTLLSDVEQAVWPSIREKLNPIVWAAYRGDEHKTVTKLLGFYSITVGSFGIAALIITKLFGAEPAAGAQ